MSELQIDLELIEAVKRGDTHAFDTLVTRYQSRISKIVSRYVKDPSEVLDVSQEVFIKAYRALKKFRGDSSFYTWLYRIAINTSKNYILSQGRRLPDIDIYIEDMERFLMRNTPREHSTPERLLMRDEIEHAVYDTINHLPKDLKTAIMLREMEGLSYDEIAVVMGCPVGTVRSRIFRARAAIDKNVQPLLSD
jgi:RNA polymerase sigma-70 factor (ECF subfamily)